MKPHWQTDQATLYCADATEALESEYLHCPLCGSQGGFQYFAEWCDRYYACVYCGGDWAAVCRSTALALGVSRISVDAVGLQTRPLVVSKIAGNVIILNASESERGHCPLI